MIGLGLPPTQAVASNNFGAFWAGAGSLFKYKDSNLVEKSLLTKLTILGALGSLSGVWFLLNIDEGILQIIIAFLLLALLFLFVWKPQLGFKERKTSPNLQRT